MGCRENGGTPRCSGAIDFFHHYRKKETRGDDIGGDGRAVAGGASTTKRTKTMMVVVSITGTSDAGPQVPRSRTPVWRSTCS